MTIETLRVQVWLVMGDCFFIGLAPVLVHMAKNAQGKYSFHPVAVNLLVECAKLIFATVVLVANVRRRPDRNLNVRTNPTMTMSLHPAFQNPSHHRHFTNLVLRPMGGSLTLTPSSVAEGTSTAAVLCVHPAAFSRTLIALRQCTLPRRRFVAAPPAQRWT